MHVFQSRIPNESTNPASRLESSSPFDTLAKQPKHPQQFQQQSQPPLLLSIGVPRMSSKSNLDQNQSHSNTTSSMKDRRTTNTRNRHLHQQSQSPLSYSKSISNLSAIQDSNGIQLVRASSNTLQSAQLVSLNSPTITADPQHKRFKSKESSPHSLYNIQSRDSSPINSRVLNMLTRSDIIARKKQSLPNSKSLQHSTIFPFKTRNNTILSDISAPNNHSSINIPNSIMPSSQHSTPFQLIAGKNNEYIQQFLKRNVSPKQDQIPIVIYDSFPMRKIRPQISQLSEGLGALLSPQQQPHCASNSKPRIKQFQPLKMAPPLVKMPFSEKSPVYEMGILSRKPDSQLGVNPAFSRTLLQSQHYQTTPDEAIIHANDHIRLDWTPQKGYSMAPAHPQQQPTVLTFNSIGSCSSLSQFKKNRNSTHSIKQFTTTNQLQRQRAVLEQKPSSEDSLLKSRNNSQNGMLPSQMEGSFDEEVNQEGATRSCMSPMMTIPNEHGDSPQAAGAGSSRNSQNTNTRSTSTAQRAIKLYSEGFDHFHRSKELQSDLTQLSRQLIKTQLSTMHSQQELNGIRAGVRITDAEVLIRNQIPASKITIKKSYQGPSYPTNLLLRGHTSTNNNPSDRRLRSIGDIPGTRDENLTASNSSITNDTTTPNTKHIYFALPDRQNFFLTKQTGVFPGHIKQHKVLH